jgi:prepilin-type N-terminal cleavage/methylation domain-containing protein
MKYLFICLRFENDANIKYDKSMSVKKINTHHGFTIVELLIVIVVVAILAAISIVAYTGVQSRARQSIVQAELSDAKKKLTLYKVDQGNYPTTNASLTQADLRISSPSNYENRAGYSNYYYCVDVANNKFAIGARTAGSDMKSYYVTTGEGVGVYPGLITLSETCARLGLPGTTSADGAYVSSGLSTTGAVSSWLKVGN